MSTTPLLSIIIPVYNTRSYLSTCLDSILRQEWTDYEIILVDEAEIDRYNILEADRKAMTKIALDSPGEVILTDAMKLGIDRPVIDRPDDGV